MSLKIENCKPIIFSFSANIPENILAEIKKVIPEASECEYLGQYYDDGIGATVHGYIVFVPYFCTIHESFVSQIGDRAEVYYSPSGHSFFNQNERYWSQAVQEVYVEFH